MAEPGPTPFYDPELRAAIEAGPQLGTVNAGTLEQVRTDRMEANGLLQLSDEVDRTDVMVPGPDGAGEIRLRVHRPAGPERPRPCIYWMHGGGYVLGSPEQDDERFDRWCQRFDVVGVCPQYRLAPEHPYPAGLEDCYAGLRWVEAHGAGIGIDAGRVGIGGPSGGGGLAAALALLARDRGELTIDYQLLIYPMIDDTRTCTTANWDVPVWNQESNTFGWSSYLGPLLGTDDVPYTAAPARCPDLSGLPPTYVMTGSLDGFCDEDISYAQRLNQAGVPVELHVYPGAPHGFEGLAPATAVARQARRDINNWLAARLGVARH